MSTPGPIVAVFLVAAIGAVACTGGEDRRQDGNGCRFEVALPRRGDVPVAVDAVDRDDVWVVGAHYDGGASVPYARRWDGSAWKGVPVELVADANAGFHDVAAVSADDAGAVGSLRSREPIVERWDGVRWSNVPVPSAGSQVSELFGVTASSDGTVWAVGRALDGRRWRTLVLEWDGGAWTVMNDVPSPRGADGALRGADASAGDDGWAVGWSAGPEGRLGALALHFDGTSWRPMKTPDPGTEDQVLSAVVATDDGSAWAVGWSIGDEGRDLPLILRWGGRRWEKVPVPEVAGRAQLIDVAAEGPGDVWAAGRATDETGTFASFLLHWDGRSWERVVAPDVGADDDTLAGVAVTDGSPWGVGTSVDAEGKYASLVLTGC
jgi:hypothetical protein